MSSTRSMNTALEKHVHAFGKSDDGDADLTKRSIVKTMVDIGESPEKADEVASRVTVIGSVIARRGLCCPFGQFSGNLAARRMHHARDTKIYNPDGTINEDEWSKLVSYTEQVSDERIITKSEFYKFLTKQRESDTRSDIFSIGENASNDEWDSFWRLLSNREYNGEPAVTLQRMRDFFEDSNKVFAEVKAARAESTTTSTCSP